MFSEILEKSTNSLLSRCNFPSSCSLARTNSERISFDVLSSAEESMASRLAWIWEFINALMVSNTSRVCRTLWIGMSMTLNSKNWGRKTYHGNGNFQAHLGAAIAKLFLSVIISKHCWIDIRPSWEGGSPQENGRPKPAVAMMMRVNCKWLISSMSVARRHLPWLSVIGYVERLLSLYLPTPHSQSFQNMPYV